jgi:hypothetical protein
VSTIQGDRKGLIEKEIIDLGRPEDYNFWNVIGRSAEDDITETSENLFRLLSQYNLKTNKQFFKDFRKHFYEVVLPSESEFTSLGTLTSYRNLVILSGFDCFRRAREQVDYGILEQSNLAEIGKDLYSICFVPLRVVMLLSKRSSINQVRWVLPIGV